MFENLEVFKNRFEELNQRLYDPAVVSDPEVYTALMKEYKELTPIVEKYREYTDAQNSLAEARELLNEGGLDKDFKEMVDQELQQAKDDIERTSEELKILLLPRDPNDE
jgi:peptide chain release factor 1